MATVTIEGASPYSQGRGYGRRHPKLPKEGHDQYEERTWRERCHYREKDGRIYIPGSALYLAMVSAAKFRGESIPGQGKKTWTKRFVSGVLPMNNPVLEPGVTKDEVKGVDVFVPSTGNAAFDGGGGKRVWKTFPTIEEWSCVAEFMIVDPLITDQVFRDHITEAGMSIGIGTYRPQSRGTNGRFRVTGFEWSEA